MCKVIHNKKKGKKGHNIPSAAGNSFTTQSAYNLSQVPCYK